ncbi:MAG: TlyA family RNA methyltransferase [Firmicutes bacterium]|nr:TlyA family RNA methyltransferase [Bacillota bacterium]
MEKERLDVLLVKRGYFDSREKAQKSIMAGVVFVDGVKEDKPGAKFNPTAEIEVKDNINPYVSRGGLKLEKALEFFGIDLKGKTAIDVGASTGGFTDCMLKNGAIKVVAIDVGYGQLAWELRNDERVICMERINIRYIKPENIGIVADFATIDVSFISLKKVIPVVAGLIKEEGEMICLVKPQFEAGRKKVGKRGVVRNPETHMEVLQDIIIFAIDIGLKVKGLTYSPIKGTEGNIEYLLYLSKQNKLTDKSIDKSIIEDEIKKVVMQSHLINKTI